MNIITHLTNQWRNWGGEQKGTAAPDAAGQGRKPASPNVFYV